MIPGINLLNKAFQLIAQQTVSYSRFVSRSTDAAGFIIPVYATPITLKGSFQPVPRKLYEQLGLDLQKSYFNFYTSKNIIDVSRDVAGDQIVFVGKRYECISNTDWYNMDGWVATLCVLIGAAS